MGRNGLGVEQVLGRKREPKGQVGAGDRERDRQKGFASREFFCGFAPVSFWFSLKMPVGEVAIVSLPLEGIHCPHQCPRSRIFPSGGGQ